MKGLGEMSVGEVAAHVAGHLLNNGISVVLTGGSCVSIYTDNRYQSFDLDFIEETRDTPRFSLTHNYTFITSRKGHRVRPAFLRPRGTADHF